MNTPAKASLPVIKRLPKYYRYLRSLQADGITSISSRELAAQMVLGSAALALSSPEHTASLKDAVCSPGGTTIQGLRLLEQKGFRSAVIEAVIAAYEKNFDLK